MKHAARALVAAWLRWAAALRQPRHKDRVYGPPPADTRCGRSPEAEVVAGRAAQPVVARPHKHVLQRGQQAPRGRHRTRQVVPVLQAPGVGRQENGRLQAGGQARRGTCCHLAVSQSAGAEIASSKAGQGRAVRTRLRTLGRSRPRQSPQSPAICGAGQTPAGPLSHRPSIHPRSATHHRPATHQPERLQLRQAAAGGILAVPGGRQRALQPNVAQRPASGSSAWRWQAA